MRSKIIFAVVVLNLCGMSVAHSFTLHKDYADSKKNEVKKTQEMNDALSEVIDTREYHQAKKAEIGKHGEVILQSSY